MGRETGSLGLATVPQARSQKAKAKLRLKEDKICFKGIWSVGPPLLSGSGFYRRSANLWRFLISPIYSSFAGQIRQPTEPTKEPKNWLMRSFK
jgi:hypothetical protein